MELYSQELWYAINTEVDCFSVERGGVVMNRWERAFRRLLFCLLGAPLALADGGVFQFIAANPHGPPPNAC